MRLLEKQSVFAVMVADLISFVHARRYLVSLGEAWRPPETARLYAERGIGIENSLHRQKLAIDLNIFHQDGSALTVEEYLPIGEFWEARGGAWGGRFQDYGHFSLEHDGVR